MAVDHGCLPTDEVGYLRPMTDELRSDWESEHDEHLKKLIELTKDSRFCMLTTVGADGVPLRVARCHDKKSTSMSSCGSSQHETHARPSTYALAPLSR